MTLTWSDLIILTTASYVRFSITSSFTGVLSEIKNVCQTIQCIFIPVCTWCIASIRVIVVWRYVFSLYLIFRYLLGWTKVKYIQHTPIAGRCCLTFILRSYIRLQVVIVMSKKITVLWSVHCVVDYMNKKNLKIPTLFIFRVKDILLQWKYRQTVTSSKTLLPIYLRHSVTPQKTVIMTVMLQQLSTCCLSKCIYKMPLHLFFSE